jgi:ankyrin repeat protein
LKWLWFVAIWRLNTSHDDNSRRTYHVTAVMTSSESDLYDRLISAVERDDVTAARAALLDGADVNGNEDDDIGTPLHVAAVHNSVRCADLLLAQTGVDVDSLATVHRQTPLMTSAAHGHVTVLRRLLTAGAAVDRQTAGCSTALIVACHYGHVDCAHALLDSGADPCITNPWGYTALYMATDTPEILRRLLADYAGRIDVDQRCGDRQETALHLAAVIGSVTAIDALIAAGADVNARTTHDENALWLAAWKGQTEAALALIRHNIELDVPSNGWQVYVKHYLPLEVALGLQDYRVVHTLLRAGCAVRNPKLIGDADTSTEPRSGSAVPLPDAAPWVRLHTEAFDFVRGNPEELTRLVGILRNPANLRELCRLMIRRHLGTPLIAKVAKLDGMIPNVLKDFLAMNDFIL